MKKFFYSSFIFLLIAMFVSCASTNQKIHCIHELQKKAVLMGWSMSLEQLNYETDAVFFGDSLTFGGDFQSFFPDKKIINLGIPGDSAKDLLERCEMIKTTSPKAIFVLGGINGLKQERMKEVVENYEKMVEKIILENPQAKIFIQSCLPVSQKAEEKFCKNQDIDTFNNFIKKIAEKHNCIYVELNILYKKDGFMNPDYTIEGVHLKNYEPWINEIKKYLDWDVQ